MQVKQSNNSSLPDTHPNQFIPTQSDEIRLEDSAPQLDLLPGDRPEMPPPALPAPPQKLQRRWYHVSWGGLLLITAILGVGGFLALPSFVGCGNKARQAEGKYTVGTFNRAQQAYFLDHKAFATSIPALETGYKAETPNYQFSVRATKQAAFSYGMARPATKNVRSYVGAVFIVPGSQAQYPETAAILCEAINPGPGQVADPILQQRTPTCAPGTRDVATK